MKNFIYYPTFEPLDITWIKYALIYMDGFSPIIPRSGQPALSEQFKMLENETDLITEKIEPTYGHGEIASTKTIQEVAKILIHPELYLDKLNVINPVRTLTDPANWTFKLYGEKYVETFKNYCKDNKLAAETDGGILLSKELANLYMIFLADEVAYQTKASPITDLEKLDHLSTYLRIGTGDDRLEAVKATINLQLPKNIENLDIKKLIDFRINSSKLRSHFNKTLDGYLTSIEQGFDPSVFVKELNKTNTEFAKEVAFLTGGVVAAALGAIILLNEKNSVATLEVVEKAIEGTALFVGGGLSMQKAWQLNEDRRNARKFMSRIRQI